MKMPMKLLRINFKNKYFNNFITGQGFIFKCMSFHDWQKILRFTVFRLLKNVFVKLSCPWHDIIINPPCRTVPQQICPETFVPCLVWKAFRKRSLHNLWGKTLYPCSIGKLCGAISSLNICKEMQIKTC